MAEVQLIHSTLVRRTA